MPMAANSVHYKVNLTSGICTICENLVRDIQTKITDTTTEVSRVLYMYIHQKILRYSRSDLAEELNRSDLGK